MSRLEFIYRAVNAIASNQYDATSLFPLSERLSQQMSPSKREQSDFPKARPDHDRCPFAVS